ncbi:hypothetical protein BH23BAC4_BH23BAC4_17630 [soil metagenome]
MNTYKATLLAALAILLTFSACGGPEAQADESSAAPETSSIVFDEAMKDRACELLTAEMVADVAGVPVEELSQFAPWSSLCEYSWGSGNQIRLSGITVHDESATARNRFEAAYSEYTAEEMDGGRQAMNAELDRQSAAGEIDGAAAEQASGLGGMFADIAASTKYDRIDGVGDLAVYDGTVRNMNMPIIGEIVVSESQAYVLLGNLNFSVEGRVQPPGGERERSTPPPPEELAANRDFTVEIARRVADRLREM